MNEVILTLLDNVKVVVNIEHIHYFHQRSSEKGTPFTEIIMSGDHKGLVVLEDPAEVLTAIRNAREKGSFDFAMANRFLNEAYAEFKAGQIGGGR